MKRHSVQWAFVDFDIGGSLDVFRSVVVQLLLFIRLSISNSLGRNGLQIIGQFCVEFVAVNR